MKKIAKSLLAIGATALVTAGAIAFFSDTETSTGNTFQAGALDLKVDSQCHYYHFVGLLNDPDKEGVGQPDGFVDVGCFKVNPRTGEKVAFGTWEETDLGSQHRFFDFDDIKPGDKGENTVSLHVYDNDAWGRFIVSPVENRENRCNEPEREVDETCGDQQNPQGLGLGELDQYLTFSGWLDQGNTPGFQCGSLGEPGVAGCQDDPGEGDNIWQGQPIEPQIFGPNTIDEVGGVYTWWNALATAWTTYCVDPQTDDEVNPDGHNNYGYCHGLAQDGRMVGSTTYYLGVEWSIPDEVGNIIQTDGLSADVSFEVVQHRNNPDKTGFPEPTPTPIPTIQP